MITSGTALVKKYVGEYDFAVDGGAISTITLRSGSASAAGPIPAGSVILGGYLEIDTLFTTGTAAQASLGVEATGDMVAATVVSGAPYSTTGRKSIIPAFTGATSVKTTVDRSPSMIVTVGTITAGKGRLVVFYS